MSHLKLFRPEAVAVDAETDVEDREPVILSFPMPAAPAAHRRRIADTIDRARAWHRNRRCTCCGSVQIAPVELADASLNRHDRPIPGTATLVGFRCSGCEAEWSA